MATAVTVKLSMPQIEIASIIVVEIVITSAGTIASEMLMTGVPSTTQKASQVNKKPATKKASDPSTVRL